MPRIFSPSMKANLIRTSGEEQPIILLEITNVLITGTIRLARSSRDIHSNGNDYVACWFECAIPDDQAEQLPRARLEVDNVGRSLTRWLEQLQGAPKTKVRFILIQESNPDFVEWDIQMDLVNLTVNRSKITGNLGFNDTLNERCVNILYRPYNAPGLF